MSNSTQFARTDKAIQAAFISLLKSKPFEKITVQDILDETPVSRATFYKHYHDKYEIAEKMQQEFVGMQRQIVKAAIGVDSLQSSELLRRLSDRYREIMKCLLKIQTENVNLTHALSQELALDYLQRRDTPNKEIESLVYGSTVTAFQVVCLERDVSELDATSVVIQVLLTLLGLQDDGKSEAFLKERIRQAAEDKNRI